MARRYAPAAIVDRRTLAVAGAWSALSAVLAGIAAHLVSRFLFPIQLVLPAAVGIAVGAALAWTVRRQRLSRPGPVVALAAAAVTVALLLHLVLDFAAARSAQAAELDQVLEMRATTGLATREDLAAERDEWLAEWNFWRYARARIGLDDTGVFSGTPPVLGRAGAVALSAIELLLAIWIAALWAGRAAGEPACAACGAWKPEWGLGSAAHGVARGVIDRMLAGDAEGAADLLRPPDTREEVRFSLLRCPDGHDGEGGILRVSEVFWTRHRRLALRRVADLEVGGEELRAIADGLGVEVEVR
ncbi:MAG TPA: hypothetical protein VNO33_01995 [Kofleriaceae bacterium]|nr:hypothetical protein [Kofleriaceae bacterium]